MDKWMTEEPQIKVQDLLGGLLISLGSILFLTSLHIITISEVGDVNQVLNRIFIVFLWVCVFLASLGMIYILFQLLRWLAYLTYTPRWMKEQNKEEKK